MRLLPTTKTAKITFFQTKIAPWTAHAAEIGTTAAAVAELEARVDEARAKVLAQGQAVQAAMAATMAANNAIAAMADLGSDLIKAIRAKAAADGDGIYSLAHIPAPHKPSAVKSLGLPTRFNVELLASGSLQLKWKCKNPRATGTIYQIWRSTGDSTDFTYLGGTGSKKFVDDTLPAGSAQVLYKIQAMRSTATGPCAIFPVSLGVAAGGRSAFVLQTRAA